MELVTSTLSSCTTLYKSNMACGSGIRYMRILAGSFYIISKGKSERNGWSCFIDYPRMWSQNPVHSCIYVHAGYRLSFKVGYLHFMSSILNEMKSAMNIKYLTREAIHEEEEEEKINGKRWIVWLRSKSWLQVILLARNCCFIFYYVGYKNKRKG